MILAVLQARVSSTRLPGKVLKPILGVPMIIRQIERVKRAKLIDKLVIATSIDKSDDQLADLCRDYQLDCFRGSLDDVLDRFYQAALKYNPEQVVRLTGDCPLTDPEVIDKVIELHLKGNYDYTSNVFELSYPDGLDVEVVRFVCLERAWKEAKLMSQREHVTIFIHQQPQLFKIGCVKNQKDLSNLRWTVDEPEDLILITRIYEHFYKTNSKFATDDILQFIDKNPLLQNINQKYERNEGLKKSLAEVKEL
jgi:spore coat polysaccharide biosynthesis protein SpsF